MSLMKFSEMILLLRQMLSDEQAVGWATEAELIAYLDHASDYLAEQMIADKDPTFLKSLTISGLTPLPDDFVAFAGNVPVRVVGRECEVYGPGVNGVMYWGKFPLPSTFGPDDDLPYTRQQALLVIDIARIFALNKNEYNVSQDLSLLGDLKGAIAAARRDK